MKNLKNIFVLLFLAITVLGQSLYAGQVAERKSKKSIEYVDEQMSLLDQIIEQANIVVDGADQKTQKNAKKNLAELMKSKHLDTQIKNAIKDDVAVIKNPRTKRELHEARIRLLNVYAKINVQANVVDAIHEATIMVKNASPEELDEVIVQAREKVEAAEEEQQSGLGYWYARAKRVVTAPVDYIFGQESSYAKTVFYAAIGFAVLANTTYKAYRHYESGYVTSDEPGHVVSDELSHALPDGHRYSYRIINPDGTIEYGPIERPIPGLSTQQVLVRKDDTEYVKKLFRAFVEESIRMQHWSDEKKKRQRSYIKTNAEDIAVLENELSSFMSPEAIETLKSQIIRDNNWQFQK